MTEQQVRDILARVVPEPPDSVADAAPVVRAVRRRRRARAAGVTSLAAVLALGTFLGVRAVGDDEPTLVADQPAEQIGDPYTAAPCPAPGEEWPAATTADLIAVTAVRYCGRPFNGFAAADGAPDALVSGLSEFRAAVALLPEAAAARCAAVDMMPSDSRLLLLMDDGTSVGVPSGSCQDVTLDGRTLDGADVTLAFVDGLRTQRDAHGYAPEGEPATPLDCEAQNDVSPAAPGKEELVEAVACVSADSATGPTPLDADQLAALNQAWDKGTVMDRSGAEVCEDLFAAATTIYARTDRGDTLAIQPGSEGEACNQLTYTSWLVPLPVDRPDEQYLVLLPAYVLPISLDEVLG